jgi:hypothetical protein
MTGRKFLENNNKREKSVSYEEGLYLHNKLRRKVVSDTLFGGKGCI